MTQRPRPTDKPAALGRPNSLIALGSAAVMTVYAAGFARTEAAAQRLEEGSDARRRPAPASVTPNTEPASPVASNGSTGVAANALPSSNATPTQATAGAPSSIASNANATTNATATSGNAAISQKPTAVGSAASVSTSPSATAASDASVSATTPNSVAAAPVITASTTTTTSALASTPVSAPATAPATAPVAPPTTASTQSPASAPASTPTTTPAPNTKAATLTDGTYTGWGSSRHGDIEATVVIEGGKITGAIISRCLTQYSCSWVAHLQAQVVTRQSPEVDNVSGATQSANAFYYAVIDALKKAK